MFKKENNLGLLNELTLLIEIIDDDVLLKSLNSLLIDFNKKGLTHTQLKEAVLLIENNLPSNLGCDIQGCYLYQTINNIETYTYFSENVKILNII